MNAQKRALVLGAFFSTVGLFGMFLPVHILPGVTIDGRVVVVAVAAALGGPWTAFTAPILPIAYRIYQGGVGGMAGVGALVGGAAVGAFFFLRSRRAPQDWSLLYRLSLGVVVAIQALLWTFMLPLHIALQAFPLYLLPVLLAYPLGSALLGALLAQQDQRIAAAHRLRNEMEEKQRTERSLRESESRFRALAEHIQEVFWIRDPVTKEITYVSPAFTQIWGRGVEDLLENSSLWTQAIEEPHRTRISDATQAWQKNCEYDEEYPIVHADGDRRWIRDKAFPVLNAQNQLVQIVGVAEDITQRKSVELALRAHEERLRAIIENSVDGLCVAQANKIVFVNPAFIALLGNRTEASLLGQPLLEWAAPEGRAALEALLQASSTNKQRSAVTITQHDGAGGEKKLLDVRVATYGEVGEYTLLVVRDVTLQSRLEEQLRQSQKMEAIGQLAGGIAHDFNNLLAAIGGNAALIEMSSPDKKTAESLQEIGRAVDRAKGLVTQILAFSRKRPSQRQVTQLKPIIDEVVGLLRATIPTGIEISQTAAPEPQAVMADPSQIHQVLLNLVTNAWHAVRDVKRPARIDVRLRNVAHSDLPQSESERLAEGMYVALSVTDNGVGISSQNLPRIFEPFFTTKAVDQGTGLGLSVVHGIVSAHGGAVGVNSEVGQGTTVNVYLPAVSSQNQPEAKAASGVKQGSGQCILFIDDEKPLVSITTRLLSHLGYRVAGFTDGKEAVAALAKQPSAFDLVITDMNMPGWSGLDVAEAVRAMPTTVPVIVTSGFITSDMRSKAEALGVAALFYKPGTIEDLTNLIHEFAKPSASGST